MFFLKGGAFIFGSGLAIVPFLREGVVLQHHRLTGRQFIDAVATGRITPGPVVITATFACGRSLDRADRTVVFIASQPCGAAGQADQHRRGGAASCE